MYRLKDIISLSGVFSLKISCESATSKYSGRQDPQEQREIVNRYMSQKIDEAKGSFDLSSFQGLEDFCKSLFRDISLTTTRVENGSSEKTAGALHYFHLAEGFNLRFFIEMWSL